MACKVLSLHASVGVEGLDYVLFFHSFQFYSTEVWFAFAVPSPQPLLISMVKVMNHSGELVNMLITAKPYTLFLNTLQTKRSNKIHNVLHRATHQDLNHIYKLHGTSHQE